MTDNKQEFLELDRDIPRIFEGLQFIKNQQDWVGVCPTLTEIATEMGWRARSQAFSLVKVAISRGFIYQPKRGTTRNLRFTPRGVDFLDIVSSYRTEQLFGEIEVDA